MKLKKLLVANRGEIAVRLLRAAADAGLQSVAIHARDDADALHAQRADERVGLQASGPAAYLDGDAIVRAALATGCDAVHPGYGFLSENAGFARAVEEAGLVFVGPAPATLELFGDKAAARRLAAECGVALAPGSAGAVTLEEAQAFVAALPAGRAAMLKALAGGGGRGVRIVRAGDDIAAAYERCRSEARASFGDERLYIEQYLPAARHVEIQVLGDGTDWKCLGERECTLQRRHQKVLEIAPSPSLDPRLRQRLVEASLAMARRVGYRSLGTFEFLVWEEAGEAGGAHAFLEVNPRIQVEHTVTEELYGLDLAGLQLAVAGGATLKSLGLKLPDQPPAGYAIQLRINAETPGADGQLRAGTGALSVFEPPCGPGIRVDTGAAPGQAVNGRYDSLLAKLVVRSRAPGFATALQRAARALREFRIEGVPTNQALLQALLQHPAVQADAVHTRFVDEQLPQLLAAAGAMELAATPAADLQVDAPAGTVALRAPLQGVVVAREAEEGSRVAAGQSVLVLESMKMEHLVTAQAAGIVERLLVETGAAVAEGDVVAFLRPAAEGLAGGPVQGDAEADLDHVRPDLAELLQRRARTEDAGRPAAVARRHGEGRRTARENIASLMDAGSFDEYGRLALAAQRRRRSFDELLELSPADGMIAGVGTVNADVFGAERAGCAAMAYDYTVFAGTQGVINHKKTDRILSLALRWRLPLVLFGEGGGGRPGDEWHSPMAFDIPTFSRMGELAGQVPTVGIASGHSFAGNAALLGSCDVLIATRGSNIGMGGPAMVEGGGLGVHAPEQIGPLSVQSPNGVVDLVVEDEQAAARAARQYLGYFQGALPHWEARDQRLLRAAVPQNRVRAYDVRSVITTLADTGSVLELRSAFGVGMITALVRIEGRPLGVIANNPLHQGGAIDAAGADKAARFMRLCNAFGLPLLSLCDTPGMMVGPEAERAAQVRHASRMFLAAAGLQVPLFTVVLRKGYGLGALAMCGGSLHATYMLLAWPTGEFGAMGHEGAVRLGYRKELAAIADPVQRQAWFEAKVAQAYDSTKALHCASFLDIDDVIDPMETRARVARALRHAAQQPAAVAPRRGTIVDAW